jgi:hypothetical protein
MLALIFHGPAAQSIMMFGTLTCIACVAVFHSLFRQNHDEFWKCSCLAIFFGALTAVSIHANFRMATKPVSALTASDLFWVYTLTAAVIITASFAIAWVSGRIILGPNKKN